MKNILLAALALSLTAGSAIAKDKLNARDLIIGGIVGGLIVDSYKNSYSYNNYGYNYSYNSSNYNYRNNPCYYVPDYYLERNNPERAEYQRGVAARRCEEQEMRKRRAFECGYNGTC
jgi:hypothetical protein